MQFDGSGSTDPDSGDLVFGYAWDFGDGATHGSQVNPSHTYSEPGVYMVVMTAQDYSNATDTDTIMITVEAASAVHRTVTPGAPVQGAPAAAQCFDIRGRVMQPGTASQLAIRDARGAARLELIYKRR